MKSLPLLIAVAGLLILTSFYFFSPPLPLTAPSNLSVLQPNQKILISGVVIYERPFKNSKDLLLSNGLRLFCRCPAAPPVKGKHITATGIITDFRGNKSIEIERYHVP